MSNWSTHNRWSNNSVTVLSYSKIKSLLLDQADGGGSSAAEVSYHSSLRIFDNQPSAALPMLGCSAENSKFVADLSWTWIGIAGVGLADAGVSSKSMGVKQASGSTLVSGSTVRHGFARSSLAFCRGGVSGTALVVSELVGARSA